MGRRALAYGSIAALVLALAAPAAHADGQQDALAEQLFDEGRQLASARRYAEACDKFAESLRLAPATGTLANLAICHELVGKTATAWVEMKEVEEQDRASGNTSRRELIATHLASLQPRLSRIVVRVPSEVAGTPGLVVSIDGVDLGRPAWGSAMPFDRGEHVVAAVAPGKKPWATKVTLGEAADLQTVDVAPLVEEPPAPAPPPAAAPPREVAPPPPRPHDTRLLGIVVAGVGLVGVGVGSYFGVAALSDRNASYAQCTPGCTQHAVDLNGDAMHEATASTIAFAVGGVGLAAGAFLYLTSPRPGAAALQVVPWTGAHASGAALTARW